MAKLTYVYLSRFAEKQYMRLPIEIREKLEKWVFSIRRSGIDEIRKIPSYHDEPLKGTRTGQRSIRLNRSYRAIYQEDETGELIIICIIEVNKHDY